MAKPKRQLDPEATRAAILEAAQQTFLEEGYAAASMSAIAKSAGVTKSLIHHHFENKRNLWAAVKHSLFIEYGEAQREILERDGNPGELLRDSFSTYFRYLKSRPEVVRLLQLISRDDEWSTLDADECLDAGPNELFAKGLERIRAAQEAGLIRDDVHPISILAIFFALNEHWFESKSHFKHHLEGGYGELEPDFDERYLSDALKILTGGVLRRGDE